MSNMGRFKEYFENLKNYITEVPQTGFEELPELNAKFDIDFILKETPLMIEESMEGLTRVKEVVKQLPTLSYPETNNVGEPQNATIQKSH